MKKIVGFIGSPRENANTSCIIEEIARGARELGAEVKIYRLNSMSVRPCQSCFHCRQSETCAIEDDMQGVYADLKDAQALIIGSPIYMGQVTAQTKLLLDRLFPIIGPDFKPRFGVKKVALVYSQGNPQADAFKSYFDYLAGGLKMLGLEAVATIVCAGANDPQTALNDQQLMTRAFNVGRALAAE
ncbi:multimeric flavodoxin WrbA [Desulfofundulus luciae]|uniref:Multimeric flavodoxin WrbA n=1 Tax=Desulfofundulus luciae TaxID=74702 RepID=A0ABU0B2S1_9FIRM|nr:flavodoxin family protein [Desulfofundulus luciae]MDQ0286803.1 multimeric flavodoxin WrbA [Desulfofundulus luciae]